MIRIISSAFLLLLLTPMLHAAPPYTATAQAIRDPAKNTISVSIKLIQINKETVPNLGPTDVTTTLTNSNIVLRDGQRAQIAIGNAQPTPDSDPHNLESGCKIDLISIKGQNTLLMIATVIDHNDTIWAEASNIKITPKP